MGNKNMPEKQPNLREEIDKRRARQETNAVV